MSELEGVVKNATTVSVAQEAIEVAKDKVDKVKELDANYVITEWNAIIADIQKIVNQISAVIELINALPEANKITFDDKEKIENARNAYNQLTEVQQVLVTNINNLEEIEKAYKALPYYTGEISFRATKNGSLRTTTHKEIKFYLNDEGFKVIEVLMGEENGDFETKVGNFSITESIISTGTRYRLVTEKEYYASISQTWSASTVDTSTAGKLVFKGTLANVNISIESVELYNWFINN